MHNKFLCRTYQFGVKILYYFIHYKNPRIIDHEGCIKEIANILVEQKLSHPLIVSDNNLVNFGLLNGLFECLKEKEINYTLFTDLVPNPTCKNAEDGYKAYFENKCDSIVAVGGGSPIDTAKIIGAKQAKPKKSVKKFLGLLTVCKKIPYFIAVPTTAGTGSEATIAAVLIDETTNHKIPMADPVLMPKVAVLDPLLTLKLPPFLTATTGMDALCHAVEAYTNWTYCTKYEKDLALKAIKLIYDNVYGAYSNGENVDARHNMQLAATYAGRAFTRGSVGYVHAIGHTLSALYGMGHGHTMSIILPVVLRYYGKSAYKRLAEIATYCGINGKDNEDKANKFITWIEETNCKMGIDNKIDLIKDDDIPQIIKWAIKEANPLYPCPQVWDENDFKNVVKSLQK